MNSNVEAPPEKWDSPYQMNSNTSEGTSSAAGGTLQRRKVNQFKLRLPRISLDGGRTILQLFDDPVIEVDHDKLECRVLHWDVVLPLTNVEDISRTLGRRFIELYSKAVDGRLTEQDEAHWFDVVQRVDYQGFCTDRTPARYVEGLIHAVNPSYIVEWHDGEMESLHPQAARTLNILSPGDRFGAWVKWGRDHKVKEIEGLKML
jgi:hypothetical protein